MPATPESLLRELVHGWPAFDNPEADISPDCVEDAMRDLRERAMDVLGITALDVLTAEYSEWSDAEHLPAMSADELLLIDGLTVGQREWLDDFMKRWDRVEHVTDDNERSNGPWAAQRSDR